MIVNGKAALSEIRKREANHRSSLPLGGAGMFAKSGWDKSQIEEYLQNNVYSATLEDSDREKLFLYGEFERHIGESCQLSEEFPTAAFNSKIIPGNKSFLFFMELFSSSFLSDSAESSREWEPILVTPKLNEADMFVVDGNHRLVIHYARCKSIQGIPCFILEYDGIVDWGFYTPKRIDKHKRKKFGS